MFLKPFLMILSTFPLPDLDETCYCSNLNASLPSACQPPAGHTVPTNQSSFFSTSSYFCWMWKNYKEPQVNKKSYKHNSYWTIQVSRLLSFKINCPNYKLFICIYAVGLPVYYKAGDKTNPSNYRPLSSLPFMSKIIETGIKIRTYFIFVKI